MTTRSALFLSILLLAGCGGAGGDEPGVAKAPAARDPYGLAARQTDAPFDLDPSWLTPRVDVAEMYIRTGSERSHIGSATSTIERTSLGNRAIIRLILLQRFQASESVDTLDVDAVTLRPVRYRSATGEIQTIAVDYGAGGRITGTMTHAGTASRIDTTMTGDFLDAAQFQPLIAALPLEDGFTTRIPVFHYESGARTVAVRVAGKTSIPYAGAPREAWIVEYEGAPGRSVVLALDATDRRLLRAGSDMDGGRKFEQITH